MGGGGVQGITPYDWRDSDGTVHHDPVRVGPGLVVRGKHLLSVTAPRRAARAYRRLQVREGNCRRPGPGPARNGPVVQARLGQSATRPHEIAKCVHNLRPGHSVRSKIRLTVS